MDGWAKIIEADGHFALSAEDNGATTSLVFNINYCPICGRELNRRAQPANEPLITCGECAKYQTPDCAADVAEVVHARWTHSEGNDRAYDYCSACGCGTMRRTYGYNPDGREYVTEQSYSFCPRCGARMDGKEP